MDCIERRAQRPIGASTDAGILHAAGSLDTFHVSFKAGKRQSMHLSSVFSDADDLLRSMNPLCAQHRLSCSGGRASDGSAGGVLIDRLP